MPNNPTTPSASFVSYVDLNSTGSIDLNSTGSDDSLDTSSMTSSVTMISGKNKALIHNLKNLNQDIINNTLDLHIKKDIINNTLDLYIKKSHSFINDDSDSITNDNQSVYAISEREDSVSDIASIHGNSLPVDHTESIQKMICYLTEDESKNSIFRFFNRLKAAFSLMFNFPEKKIAYVNALEDMHNTTAQLKQEMIMQEWYNRNLNEQRFNYFIELNENNLLHDDERRAVEKLNKLHQHVSDKRAESSRLSDEIHNNKLTLAEICGLLKRKNNEIDDVKADLHFKKQQIDDFQLEIDSKNLEIDKAKDQLDDARAIRDKAKVEYDSLRKASKKLVDDIVLTKKANQKKQDELEKLTQKQKVLEQEIDKLEKKYTDLTKENLEKANAGYILDLDNPDQNQNQDKLVSLKGMEQRVEESNILNNKIKERLTILEALSEEIRNRRKELSDITEEIELSSYLASQVEKKARILTSLQDRITQKKIELFNLDQGTKDSKEKLYGEDDDILIEVNPFSDYLKTSFDNDVN